LAAEDEYRFKMSSLFKSSEKSSDDVGVLLGVTERIVSYDCVSVYLNEGYRSLCVIIALNLESFIHPRCIRSVSIIGNEVLK
jgi:hypothetical protein